MTPDADFGAGDARKPQRLEDILKALQSWHPHTMPPVGPSLGPIAGHGVSGGSPTFSGTAPEPAVTITGYALGWRQWSVVSIRSDLRLMSFGDTIWPPRAPLRAECRMRKLRRRQHVPPELGCGCGIYAMKRPILFGATFIQSLMGPQTHPVVALVTGKAAWVTGKVALWGRTQECDYGFRAQYAYPQVLWSAGLTQDKRVALGNAYGVEVYQIDDALLQTMAWQAMADAEDWLSTQDP